MSSSDHSRIGIGYLASFFFIYVVGSPFSVQGSGFICRYFYPPSLWRSGEHFSVKNNELSKRHRTEGKEQTAEREEQRGRD